MKKLYLDGKYFDDAPRMKPGAYSAMVLDVKEIDDVPPVVLLPEIQLTRYEFAAVMKALVRFDKDRVIKVVHNVMGWPASAARLFVESL